VLKKDHKFSVEVCLLIGNRLGIRQQLLNKNITLRICSEENVLKLHAQQIKPESM
jgi:hypothetical protein